jgi:hypothetical protein
MVLCCVVCSRIAVLLGEYSVLGCLQPSSAVTTLNLKLLRLNPDVSGSRCVRCFVALCAEEACYVIW